MLKKELRLKRENDFQKILHGGKTQRERYLILKYTANGCQKIRVGISVSKKISKKATIRNRQKRRIASLVGQKMPQIKNGWDIFFIALPGLENQSYLELGESVNQLLKKTKILANDQKDSAGDN
jgi:ribonuclease P protein component